MHYGMRRVLPSRASYFRACIISRARERTLKKFQRRAGRSSAVASRETYFPFRRAVSKIIPHSNRVLPRRKFGETVSALLRRATRR